MRKSQSACLLTDASEDTPSYPSLAPDLLLRGTVSLDTSGERWGQQCKTKLVLSRLCHTGSDKALSVAVRGGVKLANDQVLGMR